MTELLELLVKYGPLIVAVVEAIEKGKTEAEAEAARVSFERGFRVFAETKDSRLLREAILAHCTPSDGCLLP